MKEIGIIMNYIPLGHRFQRPTPACQYRLESRLAQKQVTADFLKKTDAPPVLRCEEVHIEMHPQRQITLQNYQ